MGRVRDCIRHTPVVPLDCRTQEFSEGPDWHPGFPIFRCTMPVNDGGYQNENLGCCSCWFSVRNLSSTDTESQSASIWRTPDRHSHSPHGRYSRRWYGAGVAGWRSFLLTRERYDFVLHRHERLGVPIRVWTRRELCLSFL